MGCTSAEWGIRRDAFIFAFSYGIYCRKIGLWPLRLLPTSHFAFANSPPIWLTPNPCATVRYPSARSSVVSRVARVRRIPGPATAHTSASLVRWEAKHARGSSRRSRPHWLAGKSRAGVRFGSAWMPIGMPARNGPISNWLMCPPPPRRRKKGAPSGTPGGDLPGSREALRPASRRRFGFRGSGDGGPAAGLASGCAGAGTAAQCRPQRSCGAAITLSVWGNGGVSWPPPEDLRKCAGTSVFGARLLSLCPMRERILPARSRLAAGVVLAHTRGFADDRQHGSAGEL